MTRPLVPVPETSCFQGLRWRIQLPNNPDQVLDTHSSLLANGYRDRAHPLFPRCCEALHPDGHSVVFVIETGRVQLRISRQTDRLARPVVARQIAADISCATGQARHNLRGPLCNHIEAAD